MLLCLTTGSGTLSGASSKPKLPVCKMMTIPAFVFHVE